MIYQNASQLIGNTPLLHLNNLEKRLNLNVTLLAKVEYFNPTGSVKDRIALSMIEDAEKKGIIHNDTVVIEPTSGNTGIGLASVCAAKGYKCILVMPENMSQERIKLIKAYGADVVLSPKEKGMQGAVDKATELSKTYESSFIPSQLKIQVILKFIIEQLDLKFIKAVIKKLIYLLLELELEEQFQVLVNI